MSLFFNYRLVSVGLGFLFSFCSVTASTSVYATVSQSPLLLGGGNVPGNLALVPSVEYPTVISVANTGRYLPGSTYVGYFNSKKCYIYNKANEWFEISGNNMNHICSGAKDWSGNFLNWAATPTIDPFRSALTGGYRIRDTTTETVLQKARHGNEDTFGNRLNDGDGFIAKEDIPGATPAGSDWNNFYIRLQGVGTQMVFSNWKDGIGGGGSTGEKKQEWAEYDPGNSNQWQNNGDLKRSFTPKDQQVRSVYRLNVAVKVCDASKGLEPNCELYPSGYYKPVGLLQQYSESLRYSVFGYLNDSNMLRDGGVLRAQQKYIGPGLAEAGKSEWNPKTGQLVKNPDGITTALGLSIDDSGVINYLNKFGELNDNSHKSHDPVSELFYTSLRYFKNQGNVPSYTTASPAHNSSPGNNELARWHDGFPVIAKWNDPIQFACQRNVILGIGDVNTHRDKNLPGSSAKNDEPSKPVEVTSDNTINVVTATKKVADLEGIAISTGSEFSGRANSAFIAGLAYDANTKDLREDYAGDQTVSTYWVDVREGQVLQPKEKNQYWLAAKYGGFKVPVGFGDPYERTEPLPESWWTSGEVLPSGDKRPDNFFLASDATKMVEGLKQAFAQIANEVQSTTASLAANSTRLDTDTAVYQSRLNSRFWSGDLQGLRVQEDGSVASSAAWSAAEKLDALASVSSRNILTIAPSENGYISNGGRNFDWAGLSSGQKVSLKKNAEANNDVAKKRLEYLRGDRDEEISADNRTRPFRQRDSRLGDIVNSDPQFVYQQDFGYARLTGWTGGVAAKYKEFRSTNSYRARVPMVIVGANDGMLHGFDASVTGANGGDELFAFVPNSVFPNLLSLTEPSYSHRYYVDGTPRISDAWLGSRWATVAVGSTGAGGKSVFALDVTDVSSKASMSASRVMWEFAHPKMGYTIGQPAIVALPNEEFGVIVSSGYHDEEPDEGYVWILDINDGSIIKEFVIPTTGNLGGPLASDLDFNQEADRVYVADTLGNVWRLDVDTDTTSSWGIPAGLSNGPLFIAKNAAGERQPITAPLASAYNQQGAHMLAFGTGSFYRNGDNEIPDNPSAETFYGIFDTGSSIDGRGELLEQNIIEEATVKGRKVRAVSNNALTDEKGWYLDLAWHTAEGGDGPDGERVVAKANLRSDRVLFTTMTPTDDPCAFGGTSMIMALDLTSGKRLAHTYFDIDGDGTLDDGDDKQSENEGESGIPWSGVSDPDDGVIKGVSPMYKWICYAGSSGAAPKCIPVSGSMREGRQSWREVRNANE